LPMTVYLGICLDQVKPLALGIILGPRAVIVLTA
jgi:hypothetical protein